MRNYTSSTGEISPRLYRAGNGEPVVLLHGATGSWRHWRPVLADLVAHFEVIAPTLPGHYGGAPYPGNQPLSVAGIADAVERQLDELDVSCAHLVGNSLGGALAIELAKRGRARSVLAISPAFGWELGSGHTERVARIFARMSLTARLALPHLDRIARSAPARRIAFRDAMRRGDLVSPAEAVDLTLAVIHCPLIRTALQAPDKEALLPQELDEVAAPVLLAWAEHDRMIPAATCSSRYVREIPGAKFRLLPAVGHVPMWDDPQLVTDTIRAWIDDHRSHLTSAQCAEVLADGRGRPRANFTTGQAAPGSPSAVRGPSDSRVASQLRPSGR